MLKIAILSYWHVHAWDYTNDALLHPDTEVAAVWDEEPNRGRENAEKLGVPYYADLDDLLANSEIDGVVVVTPTNLHRDVMVKAAKAGKHIFTEKVLAMTTNEANEIAEAVESSGVKLTVSLPRLNDPYTRTILPILQQGLLGEITLVRVRLSHNGATAGWLPEHFYDPTLCGGGALIDLGCHPVYLTRLFLGMPTEVQATFGYVTGKPVEDNAVVLMKTDNGAIGIAETGFVNSHSPFEIEVHGTEGTILYSTSDSRVLLRSNATDADAWAEVEQSERAASAFEQWVEHIQGGTTATDNVQLALDLTVLMEAAYKSANEGRTVRIEAGN